MEPGSEHFESLFSVDAKWTGVRTELATAESRGLPNTDGNGKLVDTPDEFLQSRVETGGALFIRVLHGLIERRQKFGNGAGATGDRSANAVAKCSSQCAVVADHQCEIRAVRTGLL